MLIALPTTFTNRAAGLLQILAPLQDGLIRGADYIIGPSDPTTSPESNTETLDQQAVKSAIASLTTQNQSLRRELERLAAVRQRGMGPGGRLIPTRVLSWDASNWRDSRQILGGVKAGLTPGAGVVTNHFAIPLTQADLITTGMGVLAAERLIGTIDNVGSFTSRVRLLSDPGSELTVTLAALDADTLIPINAKFILVGKGAGNIQIREVHHQYVDNGAISLGDYVLTLPDEPLLPPSITIGTVSNITPDRENALLYNLDVETGIHYADLRRLYVVDLAN
jgi:cell shape-determining protein MreC